MRSKTPSDRLGHYDLKDIKTRIGSARRVSPKVPYWTVQVNGLLFRLLQRLQEVTTVVQTSVPPREIVCT